MTDLPAMNLQSGDAIEAARHLLWTYDQPGGHEPGSFSKALIAALERADGRNQFRLLRAFPEYSGPVQILKTYGAQELARFVEAHEQRQNESE